MGRVADGDRHGDPPTTSTSRSTMQELVSSRAICAASLHVVRPREYHIYAAPFVVPYSVWVYLRVWRFDEVFGESSELASLLLIFIAAAHALSFLVCQWSVKANAFFTLQHADSPLRAECIVVIPEPNQGTAAVCDLKRIVLQNGSTSIYFLFQKQKFIFNPKTRRFEPLSFPLDAPRTVEKLLSSGGAIDGLSSTNSLPAAREMYGPNKFDIPIPRFLDLFKEHLVAPFFVFQLFCVALWFLDDMWYYSLFTLVMLFVFESTVVFQRLKNLQEFRTMSIKPYPILVYRDGEWTQTSTETIYPGDIVSIVREKDETPASCDAILLHGTCIANEAMLSGESTPQLKEPVDTLEDGDKLTYTSDRTRVIYGGTRILQITPPAKEGAIPLPKDGGVIALVARTGFSTQQGKLVRTIIYGTERVSANNLESLLFILFLLVFAIIAAWYVWVEGMKNEERKQSKVLLDCILIITAVVPPELPMQLSLAVNNSLVALAKTYVYCTEPFRIPFAGNIDVACFDKTGTLTEENLIVEGITGLTDLRPDALHKPTELPEPVTLVLASSHALASLDNEIIGDPMEKNTLDSIGWEMDKSEIIRPSRTAAARGVSVSKISIKKRFQFSSELKRMSTISAFTMKSGKGGDGQVSHMVTAKGAPEVIKTMLVDTPAFYDDIYKLWARKGKRVLALGYKALENGVSRNLADYQRESAESNLHFAGFLIFGCPLKDDAISAVRMLNNSSHRVVMITGDNALTACHVAKDVKITGSQVLIADVWEGKLEWRSVDETTIVPFDSKSIELSPKLLRHDLCCTGVAWEKIKVAANFKKLLPRLWVYARVAPHQKEEILVELKKMGFITLMAGDGTNDVGALKQAHVGIALLSSKKEDLERYNIKQKAIRQRRMLEQQADLRKRWNLGPLPPQQQKMLDEARKAAPLPTDRYIKNEMGEEVFTTVSETKEDPKAKKAANPMADLSEAMNLMGETGDDVPKIKFGDASVAAPFTSKVSEVSNVCAIVRQGRATLVAMVQMYKILALNSLITAYSLSVQYLAGIKQGDWQSTIGAFMVTACFFGIAHSSALEELSKKRPQSKVFNFYLIISVVGQAAVHIAALIYIRREAINWSEDIQEDIELDSEFEPNLLNSGVYLVSLVMQIATFAINYQGLPFRESIFQNKVLFNSIFIVGSIAVVAAAEYSEGLNEWLQLVPFPNSFRMKLLACMACDFVGALIVEQICSFLFSNNKPKAVLFPE